MKRITNRQTEVLNFIGTHIDLCQYPPTVREIAEHFNISGRAVQDHINALRRKGFIKNDSRKPRTIIILKEAL